jgi:hypothetical protein
MLMAMICTTPQALTGMFSLERRSSTRPEDKLDSNSQALIDSVTRLASLYARHQIFVP